MMQYILCILLACTYNVTCMVDTKSDNPHAKVIANMITGGASGDEITKYMQKHDIDVNAAITFDQETPLHIAAMYGNADVVEELIKFKPDKINVNAQDIALETPLHMAARKGHVEVTRALLNANGIHVNAHNETGHTPLHLAGLYGNVDVIRELLNADGINVNALDSINSTPLHEAAEQGNVEVIRDLLDTDGINVNAQDDFEETPRDIAIAEGHNHIAIMLALHELNATLTLLQSRVAA